MHGGGKNAQLLRSKPPYTDWQRRTWTVPWRTARGKMGRAHSRRRTEDDEGAGAEVFSLYWLVDDGLHEFAELPSGGDNSYPGFVALSKGRGLVSYYSSHERDADGKVITAIYLAELKRQPSESVRSEENH